MNKLLTLGAVSALGLASTSFAAPSQDEMWKIIQQQQAEIERLQKGQQETEKAVEESDKKIEATADAIESNGGGIPKSLEWATKTTIGGYGEHHYNSIDGGDNKVDAHRFVLYVGHEFNDSVRFFSEFELEHGLSGDGKPGEVELEQAYIEWDYAKNHSLISGQFLVPVGILNDTHEPDTFYGVERNLVEKNIIPTTWWETGVMFKGEIAPGLSYDFALHSGLSGRSVDSEDDSVSLSIRGGRQKSAKATANSLAYTGRLKYTAVPGLELAATVQRQQDITQGDNEEAGDDAASATLIEAHVNYTIDIFSVRALYAQWDVDSALAESLGNDEQVGWYVEPSIKAMDNLGFFVRYSSWNNSAGLASSDDNEVIDVGVNFWLTPTVVFKADYQDASDYNDKDSVNVGLGWSF